MSGDGQVLAGNEADRQGVGEHVVAAPLQLRSRLRPMTALGLMSIVPALAIVVTHLMSETPLGLADKIFAGCMGGLGLLALVASLFPVVLRADDVGIHWRQLTYRKCFPWSEIDSIGIGRDKSFESYDHRVARIMAPQGAGYRRPPSIGVNLKLGDRNAATVSYRRGMTGYELNFPHVFDTSIAALVADLQARLDAARLRSRDAA